MSALYAWLRRHPRLVDGVLAAALAFPGLVLGMVTGNLPLVAVTFLLTIPVVLRRAHPVGAFATAITGGAIQVAIGQRVLPADLAIVVLLYTLAAYSTRRKSVIGLGVCLLGCAAEVAQLEMRMKLTSRPALTGVDWILVGSMVFVAPLVLAWVIGDSMRYRRAYYANLEERAARLERDRDARARSAVAAERARIARELHDVVAHNVSVMVVQADGAAYALGTDPDRARKALAAISATGRQALAEMRVLLGVLRSTDDSAGGEAASATLTPLPGLSQLADLLDQTRAAGLPVSCLVDGEPRALPDGTALAAYRIIQESLTNVRKHAGHGASTDVVLRYGGDAIDIEVSDDGIGCAATCDGAGHGLTGMRERAALYGGSVSAGPHPDGGFKVAARLPYAPARAGAA